MKKFYALALTLVMVLSLAACGGQSGSAADLNGQLTLDVCQQGYEMAYMAVDTCVRALEGETLDPFIDSGPMAMDASNAQERLDQLKSYMG